MSDRKLRELSPEELGIIRHAALDAFEDDTRNDARYARETVAYLADEANKGKQWWLEFLSSDPETWEPVLGFDPFAPE
jgi:hypothetical protein